MKLWNDIKNIWRKPTPLEVATAELVEAELSKLEAETGQEFAASQVAYNTTRILRLRKFIATCVKEESK